MSKPGEALLVLPLFWTISDTLSTDAPRRTYISSSNPTRNKAALSMSNRSASEDEKGRGGEIVTIALVPAGRDFFSIAGPCHRVNPACLSPSQKKLLSAHETL